MTRRHAFAALMCGGAMLAGGTLLAGPDEVKLPDNYQAEFINYLDVDRLDRNRVRKMYVNPAALDAAVAGEPLPDGTVLIMEDHDAELAAGGEPKFDDSGRLIAQDAVTNIFVMEKNAAWSTANGAWDYAWYLADGTSRPDADFSGCFACHTSRAERDYTFTFWKFVSDRAQ